MGNNLNKIKVDWDFTSCEQCGNTANFTVETESDKNGYFYDGDLVICNECGHEGVVDVIAEEGLDVFWSL